MRLYNLLLVVVLMCISFNIKAKEESYLFNIKMFDVSEQGSVEKYENLTPFSNPKMLVKQGVSASMVLSGKDNEELKIELELIAHDEINFDINYTLRKGEEVISGPIETKKFTADKPWLLVTNFDNKRLLLVVSMSKES